MQNPAAALALATRLESSPSVGGRPPSNHCESKVDLRGFYDCIILAEAGLSRLDYLLNDHNFIKLNHMTCSGQGALSVQWKVGSKIEKFLKPFFANNSSDDLNLGINMERELLRKLEANCNSAISLNVSNGILNGEIYGKDKFITFSGKNVDEIFNNIRKDEGLRLLHEHY